MRKENEFDKMLEKAEKTNLQKLMDESIYNPDPDKRKVYEALYTYALDKRQEKLIRSKEFVI